MNSTDKSATSALALSYDAYFGTGYYDVRYPRANVRVLRLVRRLLARPQAGDVIDFGCGNGRYVLPVLAMSSRHVTGFDISAQSLTDLERRLSGHPNARRVHLIHNDRQALQKRYARTPAAVAMMLFGVLSHIPGRAQRVEALRLLAGVLDPAHGRLVLSVPNRLRRFRRLQVGNGGDVIYQRRRQGCEMSFFYHLYDPATLYRDLEEAGFAVEHMTAESLLPESWVTNNRLLGWLDGALCGLIPPRFGYGLLVVARPNREGVHG